MKKPIKLRIGLLLIGLLLAQVPISGEASSPSDLNHGSSVEVDSLNDVSTLSWWGIDGETYFIQVTPDLTEGWEYIDFIYPGADEVLAHGFAVNSDAFFYRLKYTDQPTADPWNDDFDGDDIGNQDELHQDTDPFAFDDLNGNGIPDDWESFWDDQFAVFPQPIKAELTRGQTITKTLYLNNPVAPDANFTVTLTGNEANFQGPYAWEDSLTGTVTYSWTEISATGTELPLVSEVDNDSEKITLTQFEFPHYGRKYTDIWVASDGYLTLKEEFNDSSNETLPDSSFPDGLIAVFWDDLDTDDSNTNDSGTIYYEEFADRLIVQYEAVTQDANAFTNTFQVILHADGTIEFFYKELNGDLNTVTVGMHDFDQTQAVQVAYNEPYLQNLSAVRFTQTLAYFVEVSPLSGTTTQGSFSSLAVDFNTFELLPGTYTADIDITHTGTGSTPWAVPAILEITNPPAQIELTAPEDGFTMWPDESVTLRATATDNDFGIERVEFFADEVKQGEDFTGSPYTHDWEPPAPGVYSVTARAVDLLDAVTISEPITINVLEDTDLDKMPDSWESTSFGDLSKEASADFDEDGFPNIFEYHHGSDPTNPDSIPEFEETESISSPISGIGEVHYYRVDGVSNTTFEKSTIQAAINAADDFDIIEVLPGTYNEDIRLDERVYLFSRDGARSTIIDATDRNYRVIDLFSESVIEGFTLQNGKRNSDGGGLYISENTDFDKMRIIGCVIRENIAGDQGGGVYVSRGSPTFVSCTIAGNKAASGGALYNRFNSNTVTLVNTLLWNPEAPDETAGQTASIVWDHSLSRDSATGNVLIDGADQLTADPGLGYDYSLVAASPARDTGTNSLHPALDLDGEALTDGLKDIGADEFNDADGDGLPDWVEALGAMDPLADDDGDTLNNLAEYETHRIDPNDSDTDGDQLDDGAELTAGTDPLDSDSDDDGMPDGWEVNNGLDPLDPTDAQADADADGYTNLEEYENNLDPQLAEDSDGDGIPDGIERNLIYLTATGGWGFLDLHNPDTLGNGIPDGQEDFDNDGLTILEELSIGTNPNRSDTDGDGVNDSGEIALGTDPLTNDDFANQDSDGDGLSDLFEINYGTDPNDADTNDNGMNDGEELDNGGDPRVPGPPPDPLPPLDPDDPPGPDPLPPPPPPIDPADYDILVESKSISFSKRGHATFQSTDPAKRYLTLSAQQSFSGGNPESGPEGVNGSKTIEIDAITGESTTTGDDFVNTGGTPHSPVRRSGESQTSSYDDPPNQENDEDATINFSSVLSNENTTSMMETNGKNELEDYEDVFSTNSATPSAYRNVHESELRFDYQKVQFKFKWDTGVDAEAKFPIRYYVLFIPEDDPDTPENEEQTDMEIVDTIEWDGVGDESPVFEIDPDSLKSGEDGRYRLLKVDVEVVDRDDPTRKWGDEQSQPISEPIYAGESTGDMVRWSIGDGSLSSLNFTWTAEGPNGETKTGPTGVGKDEWKIADGDSDTSVDWMDWKPGKWTIKVQIGSSELEFEQEIGWRTEDYVVIGQIVPTNAHDDDGPPLIAVGDNPWDISSPVARYREAILYDMADLPVFDGVADSVRNTLTITPLPITRKLTEAWFLYWYVNPLLLKGPFTSSHLLGRGNVEYGHRFWAMEHVFRISPDDPEVSETFTPLGFNTLRGAEEYRIIHRYKSKFLVTADGKIDEGSVFVIEYVADTGPTKMNVGIAEGEISDNAIWTNPAWIPISLPSPDSDDNQHQGAHTFSADGTKLSYYATGRVGTGGQKVNWRLIGKDAPWIFSEIIIELNAERTVATQIRTSVDTTWSDTGSIEGDNPFNNLNIYRLQENIQTDSFEFIRIKLFPMEGELEDFINSASGERPEPVIPPSVQ